MKMNLKLDVTDLQRNALASLLAGKPTKRLATRDDVAGFVLGALAGLSRVADPEALGEPTPAASAAVGALRAPLSEAERAEAGRLAAEGKPSGYIRGWIYAGRRLAASQ